jgi:hypothetical protein
MKDVDELREILDLGGKGRVEITSVCINSVGEYLGIVPGLT